MGNYRYVERYEVFRASSLVELHTLVMGALSNGWQPLGGVAVTYDDRTCITKFYQTMVLREDVRRRNPAKTQTT